MDHVMAGLEDVLGRHGNHHVRDRFKRFDTKYIRPWLIRDNKGAEPKILETYSKLTMKEAMEYMRRYQILYNNWSFEIMYYFLWNFQERKHDCSFPGDREHVDAVPQLHPDQHGSEVG
jgi:hypothetical protein